MNELKEYTEKMFEDIKHIDGEGKEYWLARELQTALDYKKWQKFINVIENAKTACEQSNRSEDLSGLFWRADGKSSGI